MSEENDDTVKQGAVMVEDGWADVNASAFLHASPLYRSPAWPLLVTLLPRSPAFNFLKAEDFIRKPMPIVALAFLGLILTPSPPRVSPVLIDIKKEINGASFLKSFYEGFPTDYKEEMVVQDVI